MKVRATIEYEVNGIDLIVHAMNALTNNIRGYGVEKFRFVGIEIIDENRATRPENQATANAP